MVLETFFFLFSENDNTSGNNFPGLFHNFGFGWRILAVLPAVGHCQGRIRGHPGQGGQGRQVRRPSGRGQ